MIRSPSGLAGRSRWPTVLRLAIALAPSLILVVWFTDWQARNRAAQDPPVVVASRSVFDDLDSLLSELRQVDPRAIGDSTRASLAADVTCFLMLAEQLDDTQHCVDALLRTASLSPLSTPPVDTLEAWIWKGFADNVARDAFAPAGARSIYRSDLEAAAVLRRDRRSGRRLREPMAQPRLPPPSHTALSPDDSAVLAAESWEAGLAAGLAGDIPGALRALRSVESVFSREWSFYDTLNLSPQVQVIRFPDLDLCGDAAALLRRAIVDQADSLWKALQPPSWFPTDGKEFDEFQTNLIDLEGLLRWHLARAHAALGDSLWFHTHATVLGTGPFLNHRWTRSLARTWAGARIPEIRGNDTEAAFIEESGDSAMSLLDSLMIAEGQDLSGAVGRRAKDPGESFWSRLEPALKILEGRGTSGYPVGGFGCATLPVARAIALAYWRLANEQDVNRWNGMFPPGNEHSQPWTRPQTLAHVRFDAAKARAVAARFAAARGHLRLNAQEPAPYQLLGVYDPRPWSRASSSVMLNDYIPGLSPLARAMSVVTSFSLSNLGAVKR